MSTLAMLTSFRDAFSDIHWVSLFHSTMTYNEREWCLLWNQKETLESRRKIRHDPHSNTNVAQRLINVDRFLNVIQLSQSGSSNSYISFPKIFFLEQRTDVVSRYYSLTCGPYLLDSFLASKLRLCSAVALPQLGNSDHVTVLVPVDFPIQGCSFSLNACLHGFQDYTRDM